MNEAIERAAKAVSAVRAKRIGYHTSAEDVWERRQPHVKQAIRVEVRAVLEAVREPTQEMINAVADRVEAVDPAEQTKISNETRGTARFAWGIMIDWLLK